MRDLHGETNAMACTHLCLHASLVRPPRLVGDGLYQPVAHKEGPLPDTATVTMMTATSASGRQIAVERNNISKYS